MAKNVSKLRRPWRFQIGRRVWIEWIYYRPCKCWATCQEYKTLGNSTEFGGDGAIRFESEYPGGQSLIHWLDHTKMGFNSSEAHFRS